MSHQGLKFRHATAEDAPVLWQMLCYAASMEGGNTLANIAQAQSDTFLKTFVEGWRRPGDMGVVAEQGGVAVGAAWVRPGVEETSELGHPSRREPELAIAVLPQHRRRGIGAQMLYMLAQEAARDYAAFVLNVRASNPAVRLYERVGFVPVGEIVNRVGGRSLVMRLPLAEFARMAG